MCDGSSRKKYLTAENRRFQTQQLQFRRWGSLRQNIELKEVMLQHDSSWEIDHHLSRLSADCGMRLCGSKLPLIFVDSKSREAANNSNMSKASLVICFNSFIVYVCCLSIDVANCIHNEGLPSLPSNCALPTFQKLLDSVSESPFSPLWSCTVAALPLVSRLLALRE